MKLRYCAFSVWRNGQMRDTLAEAIEDAMWLGKATEAAVTVDAYHEGTRINAMYGFPTGRLFRAWQGSGDDAAQIVEQAGAK